MLIYLAAAGVGRIGVIDDDVVDLSNLQRQIIHTDAGQGMPKVFSAQERMAALNPHIDIRPYHRKLSEEIAETLFAEYDLIVDGTDSWPIPRPHQPGRRGDGQAAAVSGAISAWEGQVTIYDPARGAPCMTCVFPDPPGTRHGGDLFRNRGHRARARRDRCDDGRARSSRKSAGAGQGLRGRMLIF